MDEPSNNELPAWLCASEAYEPVPDRDGFIKKSLLSVASVLRHFRLDDGRANAYAPSAPFKLLAGLALILLNALSTNFVFTLLLLGLLLVRAAYLPIEALKRTLSVSLVAALVSLLLMAPAVLLGQSHSAVLIAGKTLVSTLIVLEVALTTPVGQLTAGLRSLHVPALVILTLELAIRSIYNLGVICAEVLQALSLRSVGKNRAKAQSAGSTAGVVLLKTQESAEATYNAMACRGFDGEYRTGASGRVWKAVDLGWFLGLVLVLAAFLYLQAHV